MTEREEPTDEPPLVRRSVESTDPSLSAEANELLTGELREAIGRDAVDVPRQTRDPSGQPHSRHRALVRLLIENSVYVGSTFFVLLTSGAVVALATGSWWVLAAAVGVHVISTLIIAGLTIQLTDETEHVSPTPPRSSRTRVSPIPIASSTS
jgi:hypothetical protein